MDHMPNAFELERARKIAENRRKMEEMGLFKQANIVESFRAAKKVPVHKPAIHKARALKEKAPPRRSGRISGVSLSYLEIDEHDRPIGCVPRDRTSDDPEGLVDLMDRHAYLNERNQMVAPPEPSAEAAQAIQEVRCNSQGRGSVYDSHVGITCHFCRQKKLCGEEGCPRCSTRDANKECIGKSQCARCMSATGRFCRACLLIRYGQRLEDVLAEQAAGTWLCPHCYEDEHPHEGWICNSSICMTRRGLKPTGIAIYDAQERGFSSVAHLLQDKLKKQGAAKVLNAAAGVDTPDEEVVPARPAAAVVVPVPAAGVVAPEEEDQGMAGRIARLRGAKAVKVVDNQAPAAAAVGDAAILAPDATTAKRTSNAARKPPVSGARRSTRLA